ncbi:MAG TPA: TIGR02569 family protein [Nocardioidaceae bacterium]|nr:TIGR02569 family protein [Nocardioidaceae bacterium]
MVEAQRGSNAEGVAERVRLFTEADWEWRHRGPTPEAVRAFGARERSLRRLDGGQGQAWTDGRLVLKAVGCVPEHTWKCEVYAAWTAHDEVRVPEPVMAERGSGPGWTVDGWGAHVFLPGRDAELLREIDRVKAASEGFHAAIRDLPRPDFLDDRDDPWAFGDRLAWGEAEPVGDERTLEVVERLRAHLAPVEAASQVIHGDILPNVLVADGLAPAVIDWPPYFRPAGMADAIALTDAVTFRGAPFALLDEWSTGDDWTQLLIRAILYRLGPTGFFAMHDRLMGSLVTHVERLGPVVEAILARRTA